jgi:hypothetical protein
VGQRHPATSVLTGEAGRWGPWLRHGPVRAEAGAATLMAAPGDAPLLTLARVGEGRSAVLASDQSWLWARGYEGGGPHAELLRRTAFWLMQEPELEEERLWAKAAGDRLIVRRRTLADAAEAVQVTSPSGRTTTAPLAAVAPGLFEALVPAVEPGLWRVSQGTRTTAAAIGGRPSLEQASLASTDAVLRPITRASRGGLQWLSDGEPRSAPSSGAPRLAGAGSGSAPTRCGGSPASVGLRWRRRCCSRPCWPASCSWPGGVKAGDGAPTAARRAARGSARAPGRRGPGRVTPFGQHETRTGRK